MRPTIRKIPYCSDKPWVLARSDSRRVWRYDTYQQAIAAVPHFEAWLIERAKEHG
jgi:hypothetical protein